MAQFSPLTAQCRPRWAAFGAQPFLRQSPRPTAWTGRPLVAAAATTTRGQVLLIADMVGKTHDGEKTLFEGLTFSVVTGDKLAVVGSNGSGKTTLLKLMAGVESHDQGTMSRNRGASIGFLAQEPPLPAGATVLQAVLSADSPMAQACQEYERALKSAGGAITKELEQAIEKMNTYNAWEVDAEAKRVLEAVGITTLDAPVDGLSGGQRKRVALAAALLGKPDLLILDEPTNHMDVDIIRWMETELAKEDMAVVVVTHDRYFMEAVCDRMVELDGGRAFVHNFGGSGSYKMWKEAREFRRKAQANAAADARTLFRRESEWMAKQPKARQAKSMARQKQFYELSDRTKDVPQADLKADFGASTVMARLGNKVVRMENVCYNINGRQVIRDFTFDLMPGSRLGIVGPNGAGKTTLLDLIAGIRTPESGKRDIGETSVVGYLTQTPPSVRYDMRLIDYIREVADTRAKQARQAPGGSSQQVEVTDSPEIILEKVGFARPRQFQRVESLSGGERRRLHLASVLVARPNVLILDEPTNDLDLQTVEVLEEVVKGFKGVVIVVSHDRAFMDNTAERLLVLRGDGLVRLFDGTYSEYLELLDEERTAAQQAETDRHAAERQDRAASNGAASAGPGSSQPAPATGKGPDAEAAPSGGSKGSGKGKGDAAPPPAPKKRKLGFYEEQEYKKLSKEIDDMSAKRDQLNELVMQLANRGQDFAKLEATSVEMGKLQEQIDAKSERWLELAELAGEL